MERGVLRIYLGATSGVGKTHAALDEAQRRRRRGADVVIGRLESPSRPNLVELSAGIESFASDAAARPAGADGVPARDAVRPLPVDALLERRPAVVVVDPLAGCWSDVEFLLADGIDVIATLDLGEIASWRDPVARLTGAAPAATVPDAFVAAADQIELVDLSPEALRRRLAHGNIVDAEHLDAAAANRFRPEVLAELRALSLQWMAERAGRDAEALAAQHRGNPASASGGGSATMAGARARSGTALPGRRDRVLVALGGTGEEHLVRRAATLAGRLRADLVGVHVVGSAAAAVSGIDQQRRLLLELGGRYREVRGDDVAAALGHVVSMERATHLVMGATRRSRWQRLLEDDVATAVGRAQPGVDLHVVSGPERDRSAGAARGAPAGTARSWRALTSVNRRDLAAWALCLAGLPLLTLASVRLENQIDLSAALLADLCLVLIIAALGGVRPGLLGALVGFGLSNYFLTPPVHTFAIGQQEDVAALIVFVAVAMVVSVLADRLGRSSVEAGRARFEAAALSRSTAALVSGEDPMPELLAQLRSTFGLDSAAVLERTTAGWWPTASSGDGELSDPAAGESFDLRADGTVKLVVRGPELEPEVLRVVRLFADHLSLALEARTLRADAQQADTLAETDALRTALLQAVSHDLRTPLATIKACASGLVAGDVLFAEADRLSLYHEIDTAADRLDALVSDLLDMSRLQAGAVTLAKRPTALEDVVSGALDGLRAGGAAERVVLDVAETLPLVMADPALLERAVANLLSNALAWSPPEHPVRVEAAAVGSCIDVRIIDRGPGLPVAQRAHMFEPFQRFGDRSNDAGAGLGLAIAKGFIDAMGATLEVDDTPGGGLTMAIRLAPAPGEAP